MLFENVNSKLISFLGEKQYFFTGNNVGEHMCSCGESNDCLSDGVHHFDCNCDSNLPTFTNDEGFITSKDLLPITNVFYGPLLYDSQNATFTIGKLRCKGNFEYKNI